MGLIPLSDFLPTTGSTTSGSSTTRRTSAASATARRGRAWARSHNWTPSTPQRWAIACSTPTSGRTMRRTAASAISNGVWAIRGDQVQLLKLSVALLTRSSTFKGSGANFEISCAVWRQTERTLASNFNLPESRHLTLAPFHICAIHNDAAGTALASATPTVPYQHQTTFRSAWQENVGLPKSLIPSLLDARRRANEGRGPDPGARLLGLFAVSGRRGPPRHSSSAVDDADARRRRRDDW